ncbi:Fic family protein [Thiosulfativibrio zosterae]|uniref:Protein adenylyltransferase n=1 Tax=Thiosulfativibrio zosterae TaxID=2675053 RepID=A0A6F8PR65_9GAMM|nr:Fic family protein [Thiosulfativibrio zosterae]BBP44605.1 addiction module protein [Thiosulfativibrio zosterae]
MTEQIVNQLTGYIPPNLPLQQDLETKAVLKKAITANTALARLNGVTALIPNQAVLINALVLQEAKDSSEIENIITTHDDLYRSSVDASDLSQAVKEVRHYGEALRKGFDLVSNNKLLLVKDIVQIQSILEKNDAGIRKQGGTTLRNDQTGEVIFTPPQQENDIRNALSNLEQYINNPELDDIDPLIKMAVIHHQFETIHPFYDGNGRTGRILNILYLVLSELLDLPILYLSRFITTHKADYYRLLQSVRKEQTWEEWVLFMLEGIEQTANQTIQLIHQIDEQMQTTASEIQQYSTKLYSKDLLEALFVHPYTKIEFIEHRLSITRQTASKYLKQLEDIGILHSTQVGNSKFFINKRFYELLSQPL